MMKKSYFMLFLCLTLLSLGGCANTFNGVGQDMESAGQKIQKTF